MKTINGFRSIVQFLAVGCVMALSGSLYAAEVVIDAQIEPPKADCFVYQLTVPRANKNVATNRMAQILRASGIKFSRKAINPVEDRMALYGGGIEASINDTGTEFLFSNFSALKLDGQTGKLVSDEEAIKLSLDYLRKTGLLPKNRKELTVEHVGGIMQMLSSAKEPEKKAVVVYFNRELDGLKVKNFGSSITVTFADSAVPAGVQYHWREVASQEKADTGRFLSTDKVTELIKEDANRVFAEKATVVVNKVELVLYDNGGKYIQPAYCYEGVLKAQGENLVDEPVLGYVQALDKVYEPIHHPGYSPDMKAPTIEDDE